MRCGIVCLLASVLSICVFACCLPMNLKSTEDLTALLNENQLKILDDIVSERARLSFEGLMLGLISALAIVLLFRAYFFAALVLFMTQGLYYHISNKKKWMLNHLETREQVDQWLVIYKNMRISGVITALCVTISYLICSLMFK